MPCHRIIHLRSPASGRRYPPRWIGARYPGGELPWAIKLDLTFDPDDSGDDPQQVPARSAEEQLLLVVENHVTLAWAAYRLDLFVADATKLCNGVRTLVHSHGRSVHDMIQAIKDLEDVSFIHGEGNGEFWWRSDKRRKERVRQKWPDSLPIPPNVLMVDDAGRTLVVNEFGHLAVGANVAERVAEHARLMAAPAAETAPAVLRQARG